MTTFHLNVLKCPHCSQMMTSYDLTSYTVHEADYWSDGKTGFGVPSLNKIGICPSCDKEFWKEDSRMDMDRGEIEEELPDCKEADDPGWHFEAEGKLREIKYYSDLIEKGFGTTDEKELYLRIRLRWALNDLVRYMPLYRHARNLGMLTEIHRRRREARKIFALYEERRTENLERLIYLYIKSGEVDLIVLAEMYRESGNFGKALEVLNRSQEKEKTYRKLKRLIRNKNAMIYRF